MRSAEYNSYITAQALKLEEICLCLGLFNSLLLVLSMILLDVSCSSSTKQSIHITTDMFSTSHKQY